MTLESAIANGGKELLEQYNEEQRAAIEAAKAEKEEAEKNRAADAELMNMMKRAKCERIRARIEDPDVYVRITGKTKNAVRVTVTPENAKKTTMGFTMDFIAGALTSLLIVVTGTMITLKLLGIW